MTFYELSYSLAVHYVLHEFMQDEINAAGIDWDSLPDRIPAKGVVVQYRAHRKTMTHERACFEMRSILESVGRISDLPMIPRDPVALRDMFQSLYEEWQFGQLGEQLRNNPKLGKDLIRTFQVKEANEVKFQTLSELSILVGHHHEQAKEKKSVIDVQGFLKLSQMIGGFNRQRLGIFLGGTGFGKTNFAVNLALAASKTMRVGYVNMEMGYDDMVRRFAVIASGLPYSDYSLGNFDPSRLKQKLEEYGERIFLTSGRSLSYAQIVAWARLLKDDGLDLLIIDYDQKVELNLKHQAEEWKALQKLIEAFEDLAKELNLYCLILAQVNREGLIAGSHRAQFPAHTVLAFYDHELHGPVIEAKKNRHGRKDQALKVNYNSENSLITELDVVTISRDKKGEERHKLVPKQKEQWWNKDQ